MKAWALPIVEAPFAVHNAGEPRREAVGGIFQDQAACGRIGDERQVDGAGGGVDVQGEIVGKLVAKTSGAPSAANTRPGFCAQ